VYVLMKTIVHPPQKEGGRKSFECPYCGSRRLRKLSQNEVMLAGEFPAPGVEVRSCRECGQQSERDKWLEDRAIWRGA
jgi:transcription elongation factor Elf1